MEFILRRGCINSRCNCLLERSLKVSLLPSKGVLEEVGMSSLPMFY